MVWVLIPELHMYSRMRAKHEHTKATRKAPRTTYRCVDESFLFASMVSNTAHL